MAVKVHLLIIDPQWDFCDPNGTLYVKGAEDDMDRLADMVRRIHKKLNQIHVTQDSHHLNDIAHHVFWKDQGGAHPNPFTIISEDDVANQRFMPMRAGLYNRALEYVQQLQQGGRYPLCTWPPHCLIGTPGHAFCANLFEALRTWESECFSWLDIVTKGSNPMTEHYSAVKAEVPDPEDPTTQINSQFIDTLQQADLIPIAGEAGNFCLANTVRDIADAFGDDSYLRKLVLLTDATSAIPDPDGSTASYENFVKEMTARGMQTSTTTEFLS